jgi:Carboxypeptidase regulatory-like domain/TonB-dependent Receptor Plug Domain
MTARGRRRSAEEQARRVPRSLLLVKVVDEKGAPIAGAYVTVGGVEHGETTDGRGEAKLAAIPQGNRLVEVKRQGYAYRRVAADFMGGDTVRREVAMTPAPIELEGIVVTTWGRSMALVRNGFYDRQRRGFGAFMTRQRLDELRPYRTTDAFRNMRGFMVVPSGPVDIVVSTRGRGIRGCVPAVYIDGMRMFVMNYRDQADALNMVSPDDIEAIEAYQGAASIPAEYNPTGNACGVLLIWTRR